MSWLSPVQWAKWTWSAMKGAPEDEEHGEQQEAQNNEVDDEEERSQSGRQVLFGVFIFVRQVAHVW